MNLAPFLQGFQVENFPTDPVSNALYYVRDHQNPMNPARAYITDHLASPRIIGRDVMTSDRTYYVDPAGSDDTGDGSAIYPWRNIWYAWLWISEHIDLGGRALTIQLAPGSYVGGFSTYGPVDRAPWDGYYNFTFPMGSGSVIVRGDPNTPQNYMVEPNDVSDWLGFEVVQSTSLYLVIEGVWIRAMPTYSSASGALTSYGFLDIFHCIIGETGKTMGVGLVSANGPGSFVRALYTEFRGTFTAIGQTYGGVVVVGYCTFTNVTCTNAGLLAQDSGRMNSAGNTGTITGKRANASSNSVIHGASSFPGTIAATSDTGGQLL